MSSPSRAALKNSKEVVDQLNDEPNTLEFDLKSLINLQQFSYVTFLVGADAQPFYAHTAVLAARCQYFFFKWLTSRPVIAEPIPLRDIKPVVFSAFICYIYTDTLKYLEDEDAPDLFNLARRFQRLPTLSGDLYKVLNRKEFSDITFIVEGKEVLRFVYTDMINPASVSEALELFQLAKYYGMPGLGSVCERYYASNLTPESVCEVWDYAVEEQMPDVARHCLARTPGFLGMPRHRLRQVLESGQVEMDTDDLVTTILLWANSNVSPGAPLTSVPDLMPPAVLFNVFNRRYLLGEPVAVFTW